MNNDYAQRNAAVMSAPDTRMMGAGTLGAMAGINAGTLTKSQEVPHALGEIHDALTQLEDRMEFLILRLSPVLEVKPVDPINDAGRSERQMFSPVGNELMSDIRRIDTLSSRVTFLLSNLAI